MDTYFQPAVSFFNSQNWKVFSFQREAWLAYSKGYSGIVNAPTGSGKTYSLFFAAALDYLANYKGKSGVQLIWITPIRALAKEIKNACDKASLGLGLDWRIEIRSGDTTTTNKQKQWQHPPHMLITTPESLHVMFASKGYSSYFSNVRCLVVDEWHEMVGSKRGVQTVLAISRIRGLCPSLLVWGISATIGNMEEAIRVLLGPELPEKWTLIKSDIKKEIEVKSLIPQEMESYPWAGHLGLRMILPVLEIIRMSKTTLIFTNTRAQCEIWYQRLLDEDPDLAGLIAMHHGSISRELRDWVEDALYEGRLKAVVCTSSLDLGVDFRPVETIVQIGSPKGVARFVQRAGRSGHQPGAKSKIYFVPTHALELLEASALRTSVENQDLEEQLPHIRSFDVLIQYLMTLAVSEGFYPNIIYSEVISTYCYFSVTEDEWLTVLHFLVHGSSSLKAYDEYQKIEIIDGLYIVTNRAIALRHRMGIGTIVSDAMVQIQYVRGKRLGSIEEWFITQLEIGESFWFAGRPLELVRFNELTAQVKDSKQVNGRIPSYMGGRLPLSTQMAKVLRDKMNEYLIHGSVDNELKALTPLFKTQEEFSIIPRQDEFLVEYFETKEGHHLIMYPFEGRFVNEGMAALIGRRISYLTPISFSISMNDYGFELLSATAIDVDEIITASLFDSKDLIADIQSSLNAVEMAKRRFRDIAVISGLIFSGYPGKQKKQRHLQSSSQLLFGVFKDYEPENLLYQQTYAEVLAFQLEEARMRSALDRIRHQKIVIVQPTHPTPFSFPLIVDRLREKLSSEKLEDRIKRMSIDFKA